MPGESSFGIDLMNSGDFDTWDVSLVVQLLSDGLSSSEEPRVVDYHIACEDEAQLFIDPDSGIIIGEERPGLGLP